MALVCLPANDRKGRKRVFFVLKVAFAVQVAQIILWWALMWLLGSPSVGWCLRVTNDLGWYCPLQQYREARYDRRTQACGFNTVYILNLLVGHVVFGVDNL